LGSFCHIDDLTSRQNANLRDGLHGLLVWEPGARRVRGRAISAGPDRSYVVRPPLLLHDDRRADLDPVIEIDHVLIGQANAAR
jgi:hypothetical protein